MENKLRLVYLLYKWGNAVSKSIIRGVEIGRVLKLLDFIVGNCLNVGSRHAVYFYGIYYRNVFLG